MGSANLLVFPSVNHVNVSSIIHCIYNPCVSSIMYRAMGDLSYTSFEEAYKCDFGSSRISHKAKPGRTGKSTITRDFPRGGWK